MKSECLDLVGEERDSIDLDEYLKFCEYVLETVNKSKLKIDFNQFALFINSLKAKYLNKPFIGQQLVDENNQISKTTINNESKSFVKTEIEKGNFEANLNCLNGFSTKKNILFIVNFGLVGSGKSNTFDMLNDTVKNEFDDKISIQFVSSDEIKGKLIEEYLLENPTASFQKAFDHVSNSNTFKNEIKNKIVECIRNKDPAKFNIICYDRFVPIGQLSNIEKYYNISKILVFSMVIVNQNQLELKD